MEEAKKDAGRGRGERGRVAASPRLQAGIPKIVALIALVAVVGLTVMSCGWLRDIPDDSMWSVKGGADGAPLYPDDKSTHVTSDNVGAGTPQTKPKLTIPNKTDVLVLKEVQSWGGFYQVKYKDSTYIMIAKNIHKPSKNKTVSQAERDSSKAASSDSFKKRKTREAVEAFIALVIIIVTFTYLYKWNKSRSLRVFKKYYAQKRSEFPWLDKWMQKNGDPSDSRAGDHSMTSVGCAAMLFVVLAVIAYFLNKSSITVNIVFLAISVVVCWFMGKKGLKSAGVVESEPGLTLECPLCHCPHAWVMTRKEVIVEIEETTTERIQKYKEDMIFHSGYYEKVDKEKITVVYVGREIKDFECLNCGGNQHHEYDDVRWANHRPTEGIKIYNPPMSAYEHKEAEAKREADAKSLYEQAKKEMGKSS